VTTTTRALLEEAHRRYCRRGLDIAKLEKARAGILATRFPEQRRFILHPALRKRLRCPRRSGKTESLAAYLVLEAIGGSDRLCIFVGVTRGRAKDLTWKTCIKLAAQFGVRTTPDDPNSTLHELRFDNGSLIRWTGADDLSELRKKRGEKVHLVIIDEAQDYKFAILQTLIYDVFGPSLEESGGTLAVAGTPGEVCAGFWYGVSVDPEDEPDELKRVKGFEPFSWTPFENPHVPRIHARLRSGEIAQECGGEASATFQREWKGRWVLDTGSLFYRFDPAKNYHELTVEGGDWEHTLGWDLGSNDDMALVVWAFHRARRELYEAWSWKKPGALVDEVAREIRTAEARFNIVARVADTGGGGKAFVNEMTKRHGFVFEAAQKADKPGHVRLFNSDLAAGRVKVRKGSPYAAEIAVLPKVKEWDPGPEGRPAPEDPRFPNHCCDAGLYGWRKAYHYLGEPPEDVPAPGSPEAYENEAREMEEADENEANGLEEPWYLKG
jgi:hypothetical protein